MRTNWLRAGSAMFLLSVFGAGCNSDDDRDVVAPDSLAIFDPVPANSADSPALPFPIDVLFAGTRDATLAIPNASNIAFITDANLTDGFSTSASIFADLSGFIDFSSLSKGGLVVFETGSSSRLLVAGVDYIVQNSPALAAVAGSSPPSNLPINRQRTRILIEPLKPLNPSTTYLVGLTRSIKNLQGGRASPSASFEVLKKATPVAEQTDPYLARFSAAQKGELEALRSRFIRPAVTGLAQAGVKEEDLVLAWSFTTQSVEKSLERIVADASASPLSVHAAPNAGPSDLDGNGRLSTGELGIGLADTADIFVGTFRTPYYLGRPGTGADVTNPLTQFWLSDPSVRDSAASFMGTANACAVLEQSVSTTVCFPKPLLRTHETVPVLVTAPNANSGHTKPAAGWPVVIFQCGVTRFRTDMLLIAPGLAAKGFVVIAMDLPLHGLAPDNPLRNASVGERTFDLDLEDNATGAPGPDGIADPSGAHFINLTSLITSRDNIRQAVADLIHLNRSLELLDLDNNVDTLAAGDIDQARVRFLGQSQGAIVGAVFMGVNKDIGAASLNLPGSGLGKQLDASAAFGGPISASLAAIGVDEGTDAYETFLRYVQHLTDPADPINYARAANANHPIHMVEVLGDTVVPNSALSTCPAAGLPAGITTPAAVAAACPASTSQDVTLISGYLSGTRPLYGEMALPVAGPITPPVATPDVRLNPAGVDSVVVFATGTHRSLLSPAGPDGPTQFLSVTTEMQRQTINFLSSNGTCLPIGGNC